MNPDFIDIKAIQSNKQPILAKRQMYAFCLNVNERQKIKKKNSRAGKETGLLNKF